MIDFESKMNVTELIEKWDEFTSPSRFAGSDDTMDLIFVAKRSGERVKLVRRARLNREPFSSVFRGKIVKTEQGSKLTGFFTKSIFDYITVGLIIGLLFYIRAGILARGDSLNTINTLLVCSIIGGGLLLYNTRAAKRRYADFITRITGGENVYFLTKKEQKELDKREQDKL